MFYLLIVYKNIAQILPINYMDQRITNYVIIRVHLSVSSR